ncbi:tetratricopeptide repeat protein [Cystobacter fuscus]|uniref:tetratricopeptide repeat protein n=1 Tax=Cystobacter fuscus TaxID=43 RepID=UPI002B3219D6|nr:tetratricopeptide repeat protein [Cystobacter fuscus]
MSACPDENELVEGARGLLSAEARARLEAHLDGCAACCAVVAGLEVDRRPPVKDSEHLASAGPGEAPQPGEHVGRYVLLRRVGEGGMGVVFAAYDPDLDRQVALKLLKPGALANAQARGRLVREAQALARLSHPNVVTVHDVGTDGDTVFLAMELVRGRTLRGWLEETPRPWREVLACFLQAGRGLAAAHAVGLVHRDFKPDNVLLGDDGQVRVTDFGLARADSAAGAPLGPPVGDVLPREAPPSRGDSVGVRLGTPAYMSPEQWRGEHADASSDQYSFCVALHEALFGQRPSKAGPARTRAGTEAGPAARGTGVPGAVRRALLRGLAEEPSGRHSSLNALLTRLDSALHARRWRWAAATLAVGVVASTATGFILARGQAARVCTGLEARLVGTWDAAHRTRLEQRFLQSGLPAPDEAFHSTARALDAYAEALVAQQRQSCEDTHVRRTQSERLMDLRTACLEGRREALHSLVVLLEEGEREALSRAPETARQLLSLSACEDRAVLARVDPLPQDPAARARVAALRQELDGLHMRFAAGLHTRELPRLEEMVTELRALGHRPTLARALLRLGEVQDSAGRYTVGREVLEEAVRVAEAGHDDETAARAWNRLLNIEGQGLGLVAEAQRTARMAEAALARLGPEGTPEVAAEMYRFRASLSHRQGEFARALTDCEQAQALLERVRGPQDVSLTDTLSCMGLALNGMGRYAEAAGHYSRALGLVEAVYGLNHPLRAVQLNNVATALRLQGKVAEAVSLHEEALALGERHFGQAHPNTSMLRVNLGDALAKQGRLQEALPHYERALSMLRGADGQQLRAAAVLLSLGNARADLGQLRQAEAAYREALALQEARLGPRHPDVALSRNNLGSVALDAGHLDEARAHFEAARELWEAALGPEHPKVASALHNLGHVELRQHRVHRALVYLRRALAVREKALGGEHPRVVQTLGLLGLALVEAGQAQQARELLERAVVLSTRLELAPFDVARVRFALARVLWSSRGERERALALAREAQAAYQGDDSTHASRSREVRNWLAVREVSRR